MAKKLFLTAKYCRSAALQKSKPYFVSAYSKYRNEKNFPAAICEEVSIIIFIFNLLKHHIQPFSQR